MALMFPRLAQNFIKNGYFPTDSETLARLLTALLPAQTGTMRILDPCAGEGVALAECQQQLGKESTMAFGIEFDEERAYHAKSLLTRCIHADFQNCVIGQRSFGLLFLNPPYGDLVADKGETGDLLMQGRQRLEKLFYNRSVHTLQFGGVLALIIPAYSLDKEFCHWITQHFTRVKVFLAPEQRFKQVVLFGVRQRTELTRGQTEIRHYLEQIGEGEAIPPELPEHWLEEPYNVPAITQPDVKFFSARLEARQLADEIKHHPCLWQQFDQYFGQLSQPMPRPLMSLSKWHLALALAAGQVAGLVTSHDGKTFLIKGDTYKEKMTRVDQERFEDGKVVDVITQIDKFVPVIRALDMSRHSESFGAVLTIK